MSVKSVTDPTLLDILSRLEPEADCNRSLGKLLIKKVRNDLIKYRLIDQRFQKEYGMDFSTFRVSDWMKKPSSQVEQEYFDWEMAVTMIDELEEMLKALQRITE